MSSRKFAKPLLVRLKSSRWLRGYLVGAHLAAAVAALLLPLSLAYMVSLLLLIAISLALYFSYYAQPHIEALRFTTVGSWQLYLNGRWWKVEILPGTFLSRYLVILRYRLDSGRRGVVICPVDSMGRDELRRLRVAVRLSI